MMAYNSSWQPAEMEGKVSSSSSSSLAAKAMRASSASRDSSLSSAYSSPTPPPLQPHDEPKHGFWGALARKAKSILDDETSPQSPAGLTPAEPKKADESRRKVENPALQKGLNAIASSFNYIGNAVEEGLTAVEHRTADIIQGTRKHIKKKPTASSAPKPQAQADLEIQLKASRDVAMAMATKAKLLLRELKSIKADLAFAKQRCSQLEEENKVLRESHNRGNNPEDDEMIRLQLETLLAEKARLAHENSIYARENRFLREVVEYHQLTMQDVVYLDENKEEVTEVYPIKVSSVSDPHLSPTSSLSLPSVSSYSDDLADGKLQEPSGVSRSSLKSQHRTGVSSSACSPGLIGQGTKKLQNSST